MSTSAPPPDGSDKLRLGGSHEPDREGITARPPHTVPPTEPEIEPTPAESLFSAFSPDKIGGLGIANLVEEPGIGGYPIIAKLAVGGLDEYLTGSSVHTKPDIDGSAYVREAFGGFGSGSPEYDDNSRLQVEVPNPAAAVNWFREATPQEGSSVATVAFTESIPSALHPAISAIAVNFRQGQDGQNSLIYGTVSRHHDAFDIPGVPAYTTAGRRIDTSTPAKNMLKQHMVDRITGLYPDGTTASKDGNEIAIRLDDNITICVSQAGELRLSVNGGGNSYNRFGRVPATPRQLERELKALQECLPPITEAYADFFRQQLPPTTLRVEYGTSGEAGASQDPVNPERLAILRQELLVDPSEDDFKYIGGLDNDIARLRKAALGFAHPEVFKEYGVAPPRGMLLQGPPGVGKSTLIRAFAREIDAVVLNVKASTIKNAFHGETERNIRGVFQLADELVAEGEQVVLFFDEMESLAPARDAMGASGIDKNVTTELLQGMNVDRPGCIIIGATNVPGALDPALTNNTSRFSEQLEISLPDIEARHDIIEKLFLKFTDRSSIGDMAALFDPAIQIDTLAQASEGLSGADLETAIRKALTDKAVQKIQTGEKPGPVTNGELYQALKAVEMAKEKTGGSYL